MMAAARFTVLALSLCWIHVNAMPRYDDQAISESINPNAPAHNRSRLWRRTPGGKGKGPAKDDSGSAKGGKGGKSGKDKGESKCASFQPEEEEEEAQKDTESSDWPKTKEPKCAKLEGDTTKLKDYPVNVDITMNTYEYCTEIWIDDKPNAGGKATGKAKKVNKCITAAQTIEYINNARYYMQQYNKGPEYAYPLTVSVGSKVGDVKRGWEASYNAIPGDVGPEYEPYVVFSESYSKSQRDEICKDCMAGHFPVCIDDWPMGKWARRLPRLFFLYVKNGGVITIKGHAGYARHLTKQDNDAIQSNKTAGKCADLIGPAAYVMFEVNPKKPVVKGKGGKCADGSDMAGPSTKGG